MKTSPKKNERRALLITAGGLGDTLLKLPVVRLLKEQDPGLIWDALGHSEWLEIGRGRYYFDRVHSIDGPFVHRMLSPDSEPPDDILAFYCHYQKILSYHMAEKSIFRERLISAGVSDVYFKMFPPSDNSKCHVLDYLLEDFRDNPFDPIRDAPEVFLSKEDHLYAGKWLEQNADSEHPRILIHPGSGSRVKSMNPILLLALISSVRNIFGARPTVGFGPADSWLHECIKKNVPSPIEWTPLQNHTVVEYASILAYCDGYVGVDSGISHLAAALGVPSVILFGPTNPGIWRPLGKAVHVLSADSKVFGYQGECHPENLLKDVESNVEEIIEILQEIIRKKVAE